jgi:hypothetical protein
MYLLKKSPHHAVGLPERLLPASAYHNKNANAQEVHMNRNRFLLLDSRVVEKSENAQLVVGIVKKHKANPLFSEDKPWENRFDNLYGNVIYEKKDSIYKCWYSPFIVNKAGTVLSKAEPMFKTVNDEPLKLEKKTVTDAFRLRFELHSATLFSFSIDQ